jgi:hypothetical protein
MAKMTAETLAQAEHALPFARVDFEALGVVETKQGPFMPTKLRVRKADGSLHERDHMLMLLDNKRRHQAIKRARKWAEKDNWDLKEDKAIVDELEEYERFAFIIRDGKVPYDQSYPNGEELFEAFRSLGTLAQVKGDYDVWEQLNDPRYGELNEEAAWAVINAVAKEGTLLPLMRIGGLEQVSCIMLSAKAALSSPRAPLSLRLPWTLESADSESKDLESGITSSDDSSESSPSPPTNEDGAGGDGVMDG